MTIKQPSRYVILILAIVFGVVIWVGRETTNANVDVVRSIVFPVIGGGSYANDFYASRSGGIHHATDIIAPKHREIVAVRDGVVTHVVSPQASWGYSITIRDDDGYSYRYIHLNNDKPGTDDGSGGETNAYAPDMKVGNRVVQGQHIGYVGDSGNAESTVAHLHFEIFDGNRYYINPFHSLNQAPKLQLPVQYPPLNNELLPYGHRPLGLSVAVGNLDGDPDQEFITGVGSKGGPHLRTFDTDGSPLSFNQYVFDPYFQGGIDVAAGDVDGDGIDEIITSTGPGAGPHVRILKTNGSVVREFYAFDPSFKGGVRVAAGDVDGDGEDEVITGQGRGGEPRVKVFEQNGTVLANFLVYSQTFRGGVDVAAGDVLGDSKAEIITANGIGESGFVRVLNLAGGEHARIYAYEPAYRGGVRVSVGNVKTSSPKSEIVTVPENSGKPHLAVFNGAGNQILDQEFFKESWWLGYNDVGASYDFVRAATGVNRRAAIVEAFN